MGFSIQGQLVGGYPWIGSDNSSEAYRIDTVSFPPGFGRLIVPEGSEVWSEPSGFFQYQFDRGGDVVYTPWSPITTSPLVIPEPESRNNVTVTLNIRALPGFTITQTLINII